MKKRILIPVLVFVLQMLLTPAGAEQKESWQTAYYDFIMQDGYLRSGEKFAQNNGRDPYEPPYFTLYDMNLDGVPELLVSNGDYTHASGRTYVFAFQNNRVEKPEDTSVTLDSYGNLRCLPGNPEYPGIFSGDGGMGYYYYYYASFDHKILHDEYLAEVTYYGPDDPYTWLDEPIYHRKTKDTALYELFRKEWDNMTGLRFFRKSEIEAMSWEAFVKELTGFDINSPLIEPENGALISLWGEEPLTVRWRSVEGAHSYQITIKCSWTLLNGKNAVETVFRRNYDLLPDAAGKEYTVKIPLTDFDRSRVPRHTDLKAWILLTVIQ